MEKVIGNGMLLLFWMEQYSLLLLRRLPGVTNDGRSVDLVVTLCSLTSAEICKEGATGARDM